MKKISFKIALALLLVFAITTIIPRFMMIFFANATFREIADSPVFILGMFLTAGLSLLLFAMSMNYLIVNRVKRLNSATREVAKGNFDLKMETHGSDELSNLTRNFNLMVAELKSNEYLSKEFVRNFSHEIKTPISAIKGYAELIALGNLTEAEVREYSQIIASESTRLAELSKSMLQMSMLDASSIVRKEDEFNVAEQIRGVIQLMQLDWESKRLTFNLELPELKIRSNKELTYQIWQNLIDNAIRFSAEEGTIDVTLCEHGSKLEFTITDHGIGITDADKPHIFNLFFVAERSRNQKSNGVGLSITKTIVEKLGGAIRFDSVVGEFTRFVIELPCIETSK